MADPKTPDADEALEREGEAAVEVENPTVATSDTVWLRHSNGVAHNVNVGSEAYRRLVGDGAELIDGPTDDEREVSDFAMLEKAKADKKTR